jgi:uncharacterized membrane protein (DUF441 family)
MLGQRGAYQAVRPVVVGLVHGLAGSAAVALLVLATIRDPVWAMAYLLLFGAGTIVGMMLITAAIAVPFAYTATRFAAVHRYLGVASGLVSLAIGLFLAYQIGLVDGLFTAHPQWTLVRRVYPSRGEENETMSQTGGPPFRGAPAAWDCGVTVAPTSPSTSSAATDT